ncbi:GAF domain-containing protein [Halopolyspora algeriensis]|uniref:GAF domain-containing protein n=1 Tax=Halopolyspora algeriensis TaxID=1500506 RepID=A0A368VHB2_9ACTN|nr:helix-turn-helix domain-containing protein [Halopolyspora algeriensis]RCW39710.1 GAF domain-containing protein [Halopolyspora algeriensis]TQM53997.1 GAF domain-containing protein [Halopolyspora algeriensis]
MHQESLETALPAGEDPRRYAHVLARMHDAALAGERPPARPRPVIDASWRRMLSRGIDPERGRGGQPLPPEELEARRRGSALADVLPLLRGRLAGVAEQTAHIMVITDAEGRVLWRDGSSSVRRNADALGFVEGMSWNEDIVGTNAIGTALVTHRPVQVYSAEHYVRSHHAWTCACAPMHDPRSGQLLGAVDLSGPAATVNATTLALVDTVAQLAESQLHAVHASDLERLRQTAAPILSKVAGRAVVTDPHGWVAASSGITPVDRVTLPTECDAGRTRLPTFGDCVIEPVPGGWLVRLLDDEATTESTRSRTRVRLDLRSSRQARVEVTLPSGDWSRPLSPRHAELLFLLATHPEGRTAAQLATDVFDDPARTVTVRAEMSRLRRHLGGLLDRRPYRFGDGVDVDVLRPPEPESLLPHSTSPAVRSANGHG